MGAAEVITVEGWIDPPGGPKATDVRKSVVQMHHWSSSEQIGNERRKGFPKAWIKRWDIERCNRPTRRI